MKNSVDWNLVRGDVKGFNWKPSIIRSLCPVLSLNEALLRVIRDRESKRTIAVGTGDKHSLNDRCVLVLTAKQRACRV